MAQKAKSSPDLIPIQAGHGLLNHLRETYDAIARRAYQLFEMRGRAPGHDHQDWLQAEAEFLQPLQTELKETETGYEVLATLPGFELEDLGVSLEQQNVIIQGKCQKSQRSTRGRSTITHQEAREVLQVLPLPPDVAAGQMTATLENGTLRISLPRAPALARERKRAA